MSTNSCCAFCQHGKAGRDPVLVLRLARIEEWQSTLAQAINLVPLRALVRLQIDTSGCRSQAESKKLADKLHRLLNQMTAAHSHYPDELTPIVKEESEDCDFFVVLLLWVTERKPLPETSSDPEPALSSEDLSLAELEALKEHGDKDLSVLKLTDKTYMGLLRAFKKIPLLRELVQKHEIVVREYDDVRNAGTNEIKRALRSFGLRFGMRIPHSLSEWHAWKARQPK